MECLISKDKDLLDEKTAPIAKLESLDELDLVGATVSVRISCDCMAFCVAGVSPR